MYQEVTGAQHIPYMEVKEFVDPTGQGSIIVVCYTDASYYNVEELFLIKKWFQRCNFVRVHTMSPKIKHGCKSRFQ